MKKSNDVVWSAPTRIIHWLVVVIVLLNAFIVEEGDPPHRYMGYAAFTFVILRLIIGFVGKENERFSNFPIGLQYILLFFRTHLKKTHQFPGHNPLAAIVYILIWISILSLGVTGWMMDLDRYFGEEWLEDVHEMISDGLILLVCIHLSGLLFDTIFYKRKTWKGMITGRKENN